jgi:NodT family efflux transporter outer membrane factor (OMF) lipoprotein
MHEIDDFEKPFSKLEMIMTSCIGENRSFEKDAASDRHPALYCVRALILCTQVLLLSCVSTGRLPDASLPDDLPETWATTATAETLPIAAHLLDLVEDESLKALVDEALANNLNLQATALRLKAAGFLLSEPRSRLLPGVAVTISRERNNQGVNEQSGNQTTVNSHRLSMGVRWELDLWGRLSDAYAASKYAVLTQTYEYQQARDALAARVIQTWIEQAAIQTSLAIEEKRMTVLQRISSVLVERYRNGIGNLDELSAARSRMEIARADLSERRAGRLRVLRELEVLLGRYPRGELLPRGGLPEVNVPPIDVPASVFLKRPDVRAAIARYQAARLQSRSAAKALFPKLSFAGDIFKENARFSSLGGATTYWSVIGSLFQPLFEGGRIINASRAQREQARGALLDLHEVVLQVFKEVEDLVDRERDFERQIAALEIAARESEKSSRYYDERYRQGIDSLQSLLIAREQEMAVNLRLNEVMAQRLRNRVEMAIGLGAGLDDEAMEMEQVIYEKENQ